MVNLAGSKRYFACLRRRHLVTKRSKGPSRWRIDAPGDLDGSDRIIKYRLDWLTADGRQDANEEKFRKREGKAWQCSTEQGGTR